MKQLADRQKQMMAYLTNGDSLIVGHVINQGNVTVDTRLNIYRNAYQVRLKETIETDHEMLGLYLGDVLFDRMVEGYIQDNCSTHTSLRQYADCLPQYLADNEPFNDHPILNELAAFERLLLTAFDAAEAVRMSHAQLASIAVDVLPQMKLTFHPSMQLFEAHWNTVESWQSLKAGKTPEAAIKRRATWLVWRNDERLTEFRSIESEERALLKRALRGHCFAQLCETVLEYRSEQEASKIAVDYLLAWIRDGVLTVRSHA